jgi:CRISPR-associated protein Cas6
MTPMADLVFAVRGSRVPSDYRFALWSALRASLPWVDEEPAAGIVGMRITPTGGPTALLARRAKLSLRMPQCRMTAAAQGLQGARIDLGTDVIELEGATPRPLVPSATLYSPLVALGPQDEPAFMRALELELAGLEIACRMILGRRSHVHAGAREVVGYPVALHDCGAEHSMRLQQIGIGAQRGLGCGIFIPHKRIEGIECP